MTEEVGFVKSVREFLIRLEGLPTIKINDLVQNEAGIRGWVAALYPTEVEVLLIDEGDVRPGMMFKKIPGSLSIKAGDYLLGRVISPLGEPIDGKPLKADDKAVVLELERPARGISARKVIVDQLVSGVAILDTLVPLGRGQRELILGDARAGKTNLIMDFIANQKESGMICVYALIGKAASEVRNQIDMLTENGGLKFTVVVAATSSSPAPIIFLAPRTALTIAEYFQSKGSDVLVILDDMGDHAKIYREIALLGNRSPGKESYPGDIFFQHAHIMERGGSYNDKNGNGSISILPVMELDLNDFSTLIPTNLMAMTDGHLLFRAALSNQGQRPAVDISLSVSRVGRQTQKRVQETLSSRIRQLLAQATQYETISRFSFELAPETQLILKRRVLIQELLRQAPRTYLSPALQVVLFGLVFTDYFKERDAQFIKDHKEDLVKAFSTDADLKKVVEEVLKLESDEELFRLLSEKSCPQLEKLLKS